MFYNKQIKRLAFGLPADVWIVSIGIFLNSLGWAAVLPFELIYLHDGRGFSLGTAGLVVGTVTGLAVVAAPAAGWLIDRAGARVTAALAGTALALGYGGLAFTDAPWQAFVCAVVAGVGNGALLPSQSALLVTLVPPELRHRSTAVSRVAANAGFGLGGAVGGLVAASGLNGFVLLFLVNAVTYLLYVGILVAVVREGPRPEPSAGGYSAVLRDRPFVHLALITVAVIAVGWGVFSWIVPTFARDQIGVDLRLIGLMAMANALTVVIAQIPVAKLSEGRRRTMTMAVGAAALAVACLLVAGADYAPFDLAYAALVAAAIVVGVGECFYTAVLSPLVADLAPPALRGRYMATIGLAWWLGLALAPTAGAQLLGVSPAATMLIAAGVAVAAGASALALDRALPASLRLTPRPDRPRGEPERRPLGADERVDVRRGAGERFGEIAPAGVGVEQGLHPPGRDP
jgi:MFS family permease